jgi:O-antigen ligase
LLGVTAWLPAFPDDDIGERWHLGFAAMLATSVASIYLRGLYRGFPTRLPAPIRYSLAIALLVVIINSLLFMVREGDLTSMARGVAPFVPLALLPLMYHIKREQPLTFNVIMLALVWRYVAVGTYAAVTVRGRLTWHDFRFIHPFALLAVLSGVYLFVTARIARQTAHGVALLVLGMLVLAASATRGMIIAAGLGVLFLSVLTTARVGGMRPAMLTVLLLLLIPLQALLVDPVSQGISELLFQRFSEETATVSGRVGEVRVAWALFQDAPLFGHGLGYQFATTDRGLDIGNEDTRRYIHNVFFYLLYATGLTGLAAYAALLVTPLRLTNTRQEAFNAALSAAPYAAVAAVAMTAYALTSATFRSFQYNILLALLLACAAAEPRARALQPGAPPRV